MLNAIHEARLQRPERANITSRVPTNILQKTAPLSSIGEIERTKKRKRRKKKENGGIRKARSHFPVRSISVAPHASDRLRAALAERMEPHGNAQTAKQHFFRVPAHTFVLKEKGRGGPETGSRLGSTRWSGIRAAQCSRRSRGSEAGRQAGEMCVGNGVTSISNREQCLRGAGRSDVTGDPEYVV